jgi:hypothetical protein
MYVILTLAVHIATFSAFAVIYRRTGSASWPAFVALLFPVAHIALPFHIAFKRWPILKEAAT